MSKNIVSNEELVEQLNWRYAVKRFDPTRKISDEDWEALEHSLVLSPSSYGLQPWKFYVIADEDKKKELQKHSWNQPQVVECSHLVVLAAKTDAKEEDIELHLNRIVEVRVTPMETLEPMKQMLIGAQKQATESGIINEWSTRQCFLALGFLLMSAAMRGIASCPMEGFEPHEYDRVLGIEEDGYFSSVVCSLGYRDEKEDWLSKLEKVRYEKSELVKRI